MLQVFTSKHQVVTRAFSIGDGVDQLFKMPPADQR